MADVGQVLPSVPRKLRGEPIGTIVRGPEAARPYATVIVLVRGGGANLHRLLEVGIDALAVGWMLDLARTLTELLPALPTTNYAAAGGYDPAVAPPHNGFYAPEAGHRLARRHPDDPPRTLKESHPIEHFPYPPLFDHGGLHPSP
jgi:hypothetical protein